MRQAATDRSVRSLGALQRTASTSRMLNLVAIANSHKGNPEYHAKPLFSAPIFNECIVLKHRIRADEKYLFRDTKLNSTKIILPFERSDLRMGGRSFFVGQRSWREIVHETAGETPGVERDIRVMSALDEIPSLDPFLLREHLTRRGIDVAPCYFALSEGDLVRMHDFVASEINNLMQLTYASSGNGSSYSSRMVQVLLSTDVNDNLEPLRIALRLEGDEYREGIFSWKGFLYYQWVLSDLWPQLEDVLLEMTQVRVIGQKDAGLMEYIDGKRHRLVETIQTKRQQVNDALVIYRNAFDDLTKNGKPLAFRNFLLKAPKMFLMLGERIGAISHIASFWRYRFPDAPSLAAPVDEVLEIFKDFEQSISSVEV